MKKSITVGTLRGLLQDYPEDMEVFIEVPSGDYWRSVLAVAISRAGYADIVWSEYHRTMKIVSDHEENPEGLREVVVIS